LFFFLSYRQKGTKNEGRIDLLGNANALSLIVLNIAILNLLLLKRRDGVVVSNADC
jgi:hypothetical protein